MCYGSPAKSLEIARARLTPEQWARFEREFKVFCDIHGLPDKWAYWPTYDWARWAYWCATAAANVRIRALELDIAENDALIDSLRDQPPIKIRLADAYFEKVALAMMDDEQAMQSYFRLERWKKSNNGE